MELSYEQLSRARNKNEENLSREFNRIESILKEQLGNNYSDIVIKRKSKYRNSYDIDFKAYMGGQYISDLPKNGRVIVDFQLHISLFDPRDSSDVGWINDGVALKKYQVITNFWIFYNARSEAVCTFANIYNSVMRDSYNYVPVNVGGTNETIVVRKLDNLTKRDAFEFDYYFLNDAANGLNGFFNDLFGCPMSNYYGRYNVEQLYEQIKAELASGKIAWFVKNN